VAQEGPGGRGGAPFLHRHRSRLDQVGLARVDLRLEAAFGGHGGRRVHTACAARLTPANVHDGRMAPLLIEELPDEARFVLGDKHYEAEELKQRDALRKDGLW